MMRTKITIVTFLGALLFSNVDAYAGMTKQEAKKQLDRYMTNLIYTSFFLHTTVDAHEIPDNIISLKDAGFIELINVAKNDPEKLEVKLTSKGSHYLLKKEKDEMHFNVGTVAVKVNAVRKHFTGTTGIEEYDVDYTYTITHNALFKAWNPHCFKEGIYTESLIIRKTDSGWKVEEY